MSFSKEPRIIFEDDDILVLDKPSGVTVNNSDTTHDEATVQDWVEDKLQTFRSVDQVAKEELRVTGETDFYNRSGIVHRLDKETSGILLVAKKKKGFEHMQQQFRERVVEKTYIALAHGLLLPPYGEINIPVGRLEYNRKRFGVVAGGRESATFYKTLATYLMPKTKEQLSLVELHPKTGRTHQIRVHLKYLNRPIVSDALYGGRKTARNDRKVLPRLFLHAAKISFQHPTKKDMVEFESPLPQELHTFLMNLPVK